MPNFEESGETNVALFTDVRQQLLDCNIGFIGYDIALYHGIPGQTELTLEAAIPTHAVFPTHNGVKFMMLPEVDTMATLIHYGSFETYGLAHQAMQTWIAENGYMPAGSIRDVYLVFDLKGNPDHYVTELQYPVQKV